MGPLGVHVLHESTTPETVPSDSIIKKEFFFKNLGDKLEITVYPYKQPVPLQEFKSTYSIVGEREKGSVYFHFQTPIEHGTYEN